MLWAVLLLLTAWQKEPEYSYDPSASWDENSVGPQSQEEIALAEQALYSKDLYGGDMVLPPGVLHGSGIKDTDLRWPGYPNGGEIAYVIDPSVAKYTTLIKNAMSQYKQHTCITFVERTDETNYVRIFKGTGCWADVGRKGGEQRVSLGDGCYQIGTVVHEIGHTIGLFHEHQRSDRDIHITIHKENIAAGMEKQFRIHSTSEELNYTKFDSNSIMMYGNYAFSKEPGKKMTMTAKNGKPLVSPSRKPGLTKADVIQVKEMYKCK